MHTSQCCGSYVPNCFLGKVQSPPGFSLERISSDLGERFELLKVPGKHLMREGVGHCDETKCNFISSNISATSSHVEIHLQGSLTDVTFCKMWNYSFRFTFWPLLKHDLKSSTYTNVYYLIWLQSESGVSFHRRFSWCLFVDLTFNSVLDGHSELCTFI